MNENELARVVVDACYQIHTRLGPGLLESVYERILARELADRGLRIERQVPVQVEWKGDVIEEGFRADLIVERRLIIELKSIDELARVHFRQLLTYLRLTNLRLGLLVNFNDVLIKDGIKRVVNGLPE